MHKDQIEILFTYLDETALLLEKHGSMTYLEGIIGAGENIFHHEVCQDVEESVKQSLLEQLSSIADVQYDAEQIRKAFQLAVLKGMKDAVQPHHSMTPDAVSLFMSYLVNKVVGKKKEPQTLLDLAVGSGNLLHTLLNQVGFPLQARGVEVDETLLQLAYVSANLQKHDVDLFHRDSIEPLPFSEVDLVVADLPVGYYPKDDVAVNYELRRENGHSYLHYLMIEQGIKMTKPGGYLVILIPNFLFESDQSEQLNKFIKSEANVIGLLQLPQTLFQSEKHGKSIFILQRRAEWVKPPKQALMAELPSFSNKEALASMMEQLNKWFEKELSLQ